MRRILLLIIICIFPLFASSYPVSAISSPGSNGNLTVHFIDVGQGDSSFVEIPNGDNILIDAGGPAGGPHLVGYLKSLGITKIHHLILTHAHDDHIGGVFSVLAAFDVDNFYDNGFSNFKSTLYGDYLAAVRGDLSKYRILQAGESLTIDDVHIQAVNPLLPPAGDLNNDSIAFRLIYKDIRIFFGGDLGHLGERRVLKVKSDLKSQILKIGHHGENDAASDTFLEAVGPEAVIISTGFINKYARPHPAVLDRLSLREIKTFRTDTDGHVIIRADGSTYTISTGK